ncbi:ABC transporter ATP-binding protein [Paenibacillus sp. 481]|uniref:ABC transporter ATP-binding protein n=1 Tax=Paenibacillus sp. 481 TaxID=2835869 RepID=UPI001E367164|nr:ABC transporter ATP-binding protein [Paenibacillus sp. 481]UHA73644.1 ABC transporter ATP-binding protein [Paenibacillus sp. 481]
MTSSQENLQQNSVHSFWKSARNGLQLFQLIFRLNKRYMIPSVFLYIVQGALPVVTLLAIQNLLNSISTAGEQGHSVVFTHFAIFVFIFIFKSIVDLMKTYVEGNLQIALSNSMNVMICEKSTKLGLADYENSEINDQLKRAHQESSYRPYQLYTQMAGMMSSFITIFSSAMLLMVWKWWIVPIIIVVSSLSLFSILKLNREQFQIYMDRTPQNRQAWYMTYLLTNDSTFKEIKLFQLGPFLLNRYRELLNRFFLVDRRMLVKRTRITFLYDMLELVLFFWLIWLVVQEAFVAKILIGSVYGYIQAIMLTQSQMQTMISGIVQFSQNNLYMEQLLLFLKLPSSDPVYRQKQLAVTTGLLSEKSNRIEEVRFEKVSFRYPGNASDTVRNLNLTMRKGQTTAIVGKNGSGKSTLVKLLMQLYGDYRGDITINNRHISDYDLEQFQKRLGIVFQDFVHYEMSVRHNIGFGALDELERDDHLMNATKYAAIDDVIQQLPQGLDTQLGKWFKEGYQLSGGQWQRIAIARAFLRNADLYILDEPSSFLDPIAERDLLQLFRNIMEDRIGIFITHRISSARLADQIIVMENGEIIEQGTHGELMRADGVYAQMYQIQASSFAEEAETNVVGGARI